MKKAAFFLTSLVSLSLALTACQPEDRDLAGTPEVSEKCPRCKIKGKPQTKQQNFPSARGPGFFALSAIMVEKQVEAVELVRLAMGLDDAATSGYMVDKSGANNAVTLVASNKPLQYQTEQGTFKTTVKQSLTAVVSATPVDAVLVSIEGKDLKQSVDRIGQKQYLNWTENSYTLKLQESKKSADELDLSLVSMGSFNTAAGTSSFALRVNMRVDRLSLQSGTVKVLEATNSLTYMAKKETIINLIGTNHEIVNNGECYSLNSVSTILTDKTQKKIVYADSAAQVADTTFKTSAAACESRPTVDLSRGFVF